MLPAASQPLPSRFPAASQPRPELDPPMGLANFARNLDFDDWQAQPLTAKRALRVIKNKARGARPKKGGARGEACPTPLAELAPLGNPQKKRGHWSKGRFFASFRSPAVLGLSYSLPDLRITHERAPEADFGLAQGRRSPRNRKCRAPLHPAIARSANAEETPAN